MKTESSANRIEMLEKTMNIIQYIFEKGSASFSDVTKGLGMPKATVHRILNTLEYNGYLDLDESTGNYKLGMIFIYYGMKLRSEMTLTSIVEPYIEELAHKIGEVINLNIESRGQVLNIYHSEGENSVITSRLDPISPLNCSSSGKLFLSLKNDIELIEYFESDKPEKRTKYSIVDFASFQEEKKKILSSGVSYDEEEYEYGLFCIGKLLENSEGYFPACLSITGPRTRMEMKGIDMLLKELTITVEKINDVLKKIDYSPH